MDKTSQNTDKSTCSPASGDFLLDLDGPECPMISPSLPEDSPASPSPMQDDEKVRQTIAISGRKCYESYLKSSHPTSLQKMFVGLFLLNPENISTRYMPTWKEKATKFSRRLFFQLVVSVPRTGETGVGFWPTVDTTDGAPNNNSNKKNGPKSLIQVAKEMWPTPRTCSAMSATITPESVWKDNRFPNLETMVGRRMWPTPKASADKYGGPRAKEQGDLQAAVRRAAMYPTPQARDFMPAHSQEYIAEKRAQGHGMKNLNDYVRFPDMYATPHSNCHTGAGKHGTGGLNLQTQIGGKLNPRWVEWLMGYPEGWTVLSPSEMQSSRKSRRTSEVISLNLTDWLAEL